MEDAFGISDFGQTEIVSRRLTSKPPDDPRVRHIEKLSRLAVEAKRRGDSQSALQHEEAALAIWFEIQDLVDKELFQAVVAGKLYNLGQLHSAVKDYRSAEEYFERARELDSAAGNHIAEAADIRGVAFIRQENGDMAQAAELHRRALELDTQSKFDYGAAIDRANLGVVHLESKAFDAAKRYLNEALTSFESLGRTKEAHEIRALLLSANSNNTA
jgi:tetratricopeptide (TPR) repeat protein